MRDKLSILTLGAAMANAKVQIEKGISDALADFGDGFIFKGSVDYYSSLPNDAEVGDEYLVLYSGSSGTDYVGEKYVWDGEAWRYIGYAIATEEETQEIINEYEVSES